MFRIFPPALFLTAASARTILRRPAWRLLAVALLAATLMVPTVAPSLAASGRQSGRGADTASTSEVAERESDLKSLHGQIETLRSEMATAEGSRRDALDQLRDSDRAISSTQRDLHHLTTQNGRLQAVLKDLAAQSRELEQRLGAQQGQLEKLLYRQYLRGNPDPLRVLLNGDDPNQSARDLYYLEVVGRTRSQLLVDIEASLERKQALAGETRQQAEQLSAIEARQREAHARLLAQREQRQAMLAKVSEQIATQRREIGHLQRDEKRLTELIDRLAKIMATRAAEAREAARRAAQRRELAKPETRTEKSSQASSRPADGERIGKAPTTEVRPEPALEMPPTANLARMKGELRSPTRGAVTNRFGAARQEGSTWKGLFIRASAGTEVKSIAAGKVVFADWMRGFGNLLIVDHGSGYLSIYANNDSLLKQVGDDVRAGDTVATVGNSGGNPESGLYFEIRHQGKPLDPLAWVNLK